MGHYQLTKKADSDLDHLYEYGILNFGLEQAQSYFFDIYDRFQALADSPMLGRDASELSPNLRRSEYRSHVVFYEQNGRGILIVRILRAEMDFQRHL